MIDQQQALKQLDTALECWGKGLLEEAECLYKQSIPLIDSQHRRLPSCHGEYAGVLNELGKHHEATVQLEQYLFLELKRGHQEDDSPAVRVARYFLADHLLCHMNDPDAALACLEPSIECVPDDWLLHFMQAKVLFALNRIAEAKVAAVTAVSHAPSSEKATELTNDLKHILDVVSPLSASDVLSSI